MEKQFDQKFFEPLIFLFLGLLLTAIGIYSFYGNPFDLKINHFLLLNPFKYLMLVYGMFFICLAFYAFIISKNGNSIKKIVRGTLADAWKIIRHFFKNLLLLKPRRIDWLIICSIFCSAIYVRMYFAFDPIRLDEASTFIRAVFAPFYKTLIYYQPNNHPLHTQLVNITAYLFDVNEFTARIPALLAGIFCIPLIFIATRKVMGKGYGWVAASVMSVFPFVIMYDTVARGYSLVNMFFLLAIISANSIIKKVTSGKIFLLSLTLALGMFVMPSFLIAAAGVLLWVFVGLLLQKTSMSHLFKNFIFPTGVLFFGFSFLFYSPVILLSGTQPIIGNNFVEKLSRAEFIFKIIPHFTWVYNSMSRDIPKLAIYAGLLLLIVGMIRTLISKQKILFIFLPSIIFGAGIIFILKMAIPFPRTWGFILPAIFIMIDRGITPFVLKLKPKFQYFAATLLVVITIFASIHITQNNIISNYGDIGVFKEAKVVAAFLSKRFHQEDEIVGSWPVKNTTKFYWHLQGFAPSPSLDNDYEPTKYFIISGNDKISDLTQEDVVKIFDFNDAEIFIKTK